MLVKPSLPSLLFCPFQLYLPARRRSALHPLSPQPPSLHPLSPSFRLFSLSTLLFLFLSAAQPFFPLPHHLPHSVTLSAPHHSIPLSPHSSFFRSLTLAFLLLFIASSPSCADFLDYSILYLIYSLSSPLHSIMFHSYGYFPTPPFCLLLRHPFNPFVQSIMHSLFPHVGYPSLHPPLSSSFQSLTPPFCPSLQLSM